MAANPWDKLEPSSPWWGIWETGLRYTPEVPVLAARGKSDGPTILIVSGLHGDEYEGPVAIHSFFSALDPSQLAGRLIGLPVINVPAWVGRSRNSPIDSINLNRVFQPNTTTGIAKQLLETFVKSCDIVIDLRSGGIALNQLPIVGWYRGDKGQGEKLARSFGKAFKCCLYPDAPGGFAYEVHRLGKTAIGAEWSGGGRLDPEGSKAFQAGLHRSLTTLGIYPAKESAEVESNLPLKLEYQVSSTPGLFVPAVQLSDAVEEEATLGTVYDTLGNITGVVKSIRKGTILGLPHLPMLHAGDRVAMIG